MAQEEFVIHDGNKFFKIVGEELLSESGLPSGHFKEINRQHLNILGILDSDEKKQQFLSDLKNKIVNRFDYNFIVIGPDILFSINRLIVNKNPDQIYTQFADAIIAIIGQIGYLESYYIEESPIRKMKLTIVKKENLNESITIELIPYDEHAYGFNYYY